MVREGSEEADIYKRLLKHDSSAKRTIPCEIIESESSEPILILPKLQDAKVAGTAVGETWLLSEVMDFIYQVLEVRSTVQRQILHAH